MYDKHDTEFWKEKKNFNLSDHAVVLVGYDDKGFIFRNSFGEKWGNKGYGVYPYDQQDVNWELQCAADSPSKDDCCLNCLGALFKCCRK